MTVKLQNRVVAQSGIYPEQWSKQVKEEWDDYTSGYNITGRYRFDLLVTAMNAKQQMIDAEGLFCSVTNRCDLALQLGGVET